jgi:carbon-monoxide dehydrogenase catalytic subunit
MSDKKQLSRDPATNELLAAIQKEGLSTVWDRYQEQQPQCGFGQLGICCRTCFMGPCRIDPFGEGADKGVCGANADTIVARNFVRMIAAGVSAHSDHGRDVAATFLAAAKGEAPGYQIKDERKLLQVAANVGIPTEGRDKKDVAIALGEMCLAQFGQQEGEVVFTRMAPEKVRERWRREGITPRGIDREVVEIMHRSTMGVDADPENILRQGSRAALADGWGGSMIATELQDILFGTPRPLLAEVNLGVLKPENVNIIVHGHEPTLSEMIVVAASDPELLKLAKEQGAKGITLAGICCTANEILMRHGIPVAGNFLQQELALATRVVEAMVVDVQCIMPGLSEFKDCVHTKLITTSPKAKIPGATHIQFSEHRALEAAKEIVKTAVLNYKNRRGTPRVPREKTELIAGFSHEYIQYMLGGTFRGSYWVLNDNIIGGRIRGVAGVVGCNNPKVTHDQVHVDLVKELIANDVLVVQTGCSALACAKAGLLTPEAAEFAGPGLREVCETTGMPPVLHAGSCVDNSRILVAVTKMVEAGGLGTDIADLPVVGAAPEWMSEKAVAIGEYVVSSGIFTVFGVGLPVTGSRVVSELLFERYPETRGGRWAVAETPGTMAAMMLDHINERRGTLGIDKKKERVLFDMAARREL